MSTIYFHSNYTVSVQKLENSPPAYDKNTRERVLEKQQDNAKLFRKDTLKTLVSKLTEKYVGLENHLMNEAPHDNHLSAFLSTANQTQELLAHSRLSESTLDCIQDWHLSVAQQLSQGEHAQATEESLNQHAALINKAVALIHEVNEQAPTQFPLKKGFFSSRSGLGTTQDAQAEGSSSHHSQGSELPSTLEEAYANDDNINIGTIMLSLAESANIVVVNAINMQSQMNKYLQGMISDLQNLLSLITTVTKAYKDSQTQILKDSSTDNSGPSFGWEKKSNANNLDMFQLLNEAPSNTTWAGLIKEGSGGATISLCFYNPPNPPGPNDPPPNPLLLKYCKKDPDGKYFANLNDLNKMLTDMGSNLSPFIGGNLATYNPNGFSDVNTIDGLTKGVNAAIDNIQNQSGANISKLNLANQGLNQANSNCVTVMSNLLSVMMKLAAV